MERYRFRYGFIGYVDLNTGVVGVEDDSKS